MDSGKDTQEFSPEIDNLWKKKVILDINLKQRDHSIISRFVDYKYIGGSPCKDCWHPIFKIDT